MVERVEDDEIVGMLSVVQMIYIMVGLPNKNTDKFSLDDSALWAAIDDNIISDDIHSD